MDCSSNFIKTIKEYGLILENGIRINNANIVIGENGSGKTRLLKAVEKTYQINPREGAEVVTLYFPEINSATSTSGNEVNFVEENSPDLETVILQGESINFQDFLKLAQRDNIVFLQDFFVLISRMQPRTQQRYRKDFEKLNKRIRHLLNWELREDEDGITAHNFSYAETKNISIEDMLKFFSPGELMLFYFSLFLFYLEHVHQSKLIVIMDEPELHLHPKALVLLMKDLLKEEAIIELWVASHSLFLLPLFDFEQLVYIKQNKINKLNGKTYENIYEDLVGLENVDMNELLKSIENWSYYQFIMECFLLPKAKNIVNRKDEQFQKLMQSLQNIRKERPLCVLDYGAGKFRIWNCLCMELPDSEERDRFVSYEAFEPYLDKKTDCPAKIKVHTEIDSLPEDKYDVVILMNVLHEIDPIKWPATLKTIYSVLAEDGILVFLEVLSLTNGEQPFGNAGYLLLQDNETKHLFPNAKQISPNNKDKSNCWVIPRDDLENISLNDVIETIKILEEDCESQLEQINKERISLAHNKCDKIYTTLSARKYAFLAQQYINAHIAYKYLNLTKLAKIMPKQGIGPTGKIPIQPLKN